MEGYIPPGLRPLAPANLGYACCRADDRNARVSETAHCPALADTTGRCRGSTNGTIFGLLRDFERHMRYSSQIKPISYLKANAAEVLLQLARQRQPLVITQNGEAKAVIQDVASYEETQETLALLKILALGNQQIEAGKVKPVADVVARLRAKRTKR
jgi:prevent-host-death family protein